MAYLKEAQQFLTKLPSISLEGIEPLGDHCPPKEQKVTVHSCAFNICPSDHVRMPSPSLSFESKHLARVSWRQHLLHNILHAPSGPGLVCCGCWIPAIKNKTVNKWRLVYKLCAAQAQPSCFASLGSEHHAVVEQKDFLIPSKCMYTPNSSLLQFAYVDIYDSGGARFQVGL